MNTPLQFDPQNRQVIGPAGTLPVPAADAQTTRFLMLLEGQCLEASIATIAQRYGLSRPRYYQLLAQYQAGGIAALAPQKTGPKTHYRRTDQAVRQVLRYRFLDPDASPEVIAQKLRQTRFQISRRSVQRVIADYGLQKKTLRVQPPKPTAAGARAARQKTRPPRTGRRRQRGTGGAAASGR